MPTGALLVAIALKTALLFAATLVACRLLERRSAACRHLLWTMALALSLILPLAACTLPAWVIIAVPWSSTSQQASTLLHTAATKPWLTGSTIAFAWLGGVVVLLIRQAIALAALGHWVRGAHPIRGAGWKDAWSRACRGHDIARRVRVLESPRVTSPCAWGVLRPTLLLPTCGRDWPEARRRDALLHEFAHLRRLDHLTGIVARLACALHWYNPLVWVAATQLTLLQEQACDDAVLREGGAPCDYARFLVDLASRPGDHAELPAAAIGMARRSLLRDRVVAILDRGRARTRVRAVEALGIGLLLVGVTLLLVTTRTVTAQGVPSSRSQVLPTASAEPVIMPWSDEPTAVARAAPAAPAVPIVPALFVHPEPPDTPEPPDPPEPPAVPDAPAPVEPLTPPTPPAVPAEPTDTAPHPPGPRPEALPPDATNLP